MIVAESMQSRVQANTWVATYEALDGFLVDDVHRCIHKAVIELGLNLFWLLSLIRLGLSLSAQSCAVPTLRPPPGNTTPATPFIIVPPSAHGHAPNRNTPNK